jgi:hypothetical protein
VIRIYVSSVIDASADTVWARIRDFNGAAALASGHRRQPHREPAAEPTCVGCIRHFHTRDGGMIRERLLALVGLRLSAAPTRSWRARWA